MADVLRFELGDGAYVRPYSPDDADEVFAAVQANQAQLAVYMPWAVGPLTFDQQRTFVADAAAAAEPLQFAVVVDGRFAGSVGFNNHEPVNGTAEIGYWLATEVQGRGLMTAAVRALLDYGFGALGLQRIGIQAAPDNARSRAIPERLGFTQEGVLRENQRVGDRRLDGVIYGLLAREWRGRR